MPNPTNLSQVHAETFTKLKGVLEPYHEKINELDGQIKKLTQERETVKATLIHELHAHSLQLPHEAIGNLAARCW